jgi:uncharacterized protein YndB with AHSA1/START domain
MPSRILVALRVRATPGRTFDTFVNQIGEWWQPNGLFAFHPNGTGRLRFEPGPAGRLVELLPDGGEFEVGQIDAWHPPDRLAFSWRQASFSADQTTQVEVLFEAVADGTRVTVVHTGWDVIPGDHVAKHRFPEPIFMRRHAEWWQTLLDSLDRSATRS